jgi:hypothetical protein
VKLIREALAKVPQAQEARLQVTDKPDTLSLRIETHAGKPLNPDDYEVFSATPQTIDPAATIRFTRAASGWTAEVPKCEYLTNLPKELTLVLAGKSGQPPISLTWKSD